MLLLFVIAAIIAALLFGGKFENIKNAEIKGLMYPIAAFALQSFLSFASYKGLFQREPLFPVILTVSYILLTAFIFINRNYKWFAVFSALGTFANFLVISINGFYMPISQKVLHAAQVFEIPAAQLFAYKVADDTTKLVFLSDIIYIPFKPLRGFASVGDILLGIAVFILVFNIMNAVKKENN